MLGKGCVIFVALPVRSIYLQENVPNIEISNDQIQLSCHEKLLGVIVDSSLNWSSQVEATPNQSRTNGPINAHLTIAQV